MSNNPDLFNTTLLWNGWKTSWIDLRRNGWEITHKPAYDNLYHPKDCAASREKIYIRHPAARMIGRITKRFKGPEHEGMVLGTRLSLARK